MTLPKILSVDDSRTIRLMLKRVFRPFHCELFEAADGMEGLEAVITHQPDLIMLDYNMPVMDGVTMLRKMREHDNIKRTPVIMLTAEDSNEIISTVARLGVRDYIIKPFEDENLLSKVSRIINLERKPEPDQPEAVS
jgi:two-component system cell cycle response regulator